MSEHVFPCLCNVSSVAQSVAVDVSRDVMRFDRAGLASRLCPVLPIRKRFFPKVLLSCVRCSMCFFIFQLRCEVSVPPQTARPSHLAGALARTSFGLCPVPSDERALPSFRLGLRDVFCLLWEADKRGRPTDRFCFGRPPPRKVVVGRPKQTDVVGRPWQKVFIGNPSQKDAVGRAWQKDAVGRPREKSLSAADFCSRRRIPRSVVLETQPASNGGVPM